MIAMKTFVLLLSLAAPVLAQPALPPPPTTAASDTADLTESAYAAFDKGDYATALPLLKSLAVRLKDKPDEAGPVLEKIRVAEAAIGAAADPSIDKKHRKPHDPPKPGETRSLKITQLGNFDYDPDVGTPIPADVKALSGSTVKLRGYMIPLDQAKNISRFALVPDLFACCYGQPPGIEHTIVVRVANGGSVPYNADELYVTGKLTVSEKMEDGFVISLFELEAAGVTPTEQ